MNIELMKRYMQEHKLDAVMAMDPHATAYLRGFFHGSHLRSLRFDDHPCFPVFTQSGDAFVVDFMSWAPPEEVRPDWFSRYYKGRGAGMNGLAINLEVLAGALKEHGLASGRIGLDLDEAPYNAVRHLQELVPHAELIDAQVMFSRLRAAKEPWEIELVRRAIAIAESAYVETLKQVTEGIAFRELARYLTSTLHRQGMTMSWCSPLDIATKWFKRQPEKLHMYASDEDWPIRRNDTIEMFWDWGGEYQGYYSDMNRAFYLGEPPQQIDEKYQKLARWHQVAQQTIKPGMPVSEAHVALSEALRADLGLVWGYMHGVGVYAHEDPYLDLGLPLERNMTSRNELRFDVGTVMAFEPWRPIDPDNPAALKGLEGGCIEDEWLMTDEGFVRMGSLPQKLFVL